MSNKNDITNLIYYIDNGIVQSQIINKNSKFIICGYWWGRGNTNKNSVRKFTYEQQVDRLIKQCKQHNINYYFVEYPVFAQKGMYQTAISLKVQFILNTLNIFPNHTIINIDTDLSIQQYPHLFDIDADCFFINWNTADTSCFNPYQIVLPGAIMGFGNSYSTKTMLKIFNKELLTHSHLAEDKLFSGFFTRNFLNTYLRCVWLPYNYMYMYENHQYTPLVGYTKIVNLNQELKHHSIYKPSDIIITHEDFETGALDDVFAERITKNRFPPRHYSQMGSKLRCLKVKFNNYLNYGLTKQQCKHLVKDTRDLISEKAIANKLITFISKKELKQNQLSIFDHHKEIKYEGPLLITLCKDPNNIAIINTFKKSCNTFKLNYIIFFTDNPTKISHPQLIYNVILKYKRNVVYIDILTQIKKSPKLFHVKNMDFMTINLNNTSLREDKCSDIRILKTLNDKLYFFANNNISLDFLSIWNSFNKLGHYQHKYLEYAFNKSMSINKLRCYWFPTNYINKSILHYPHTYIKNHNYYNNTYPDKYSDKRIYYFTKNIQQCGTKPPLHNDNPLPTHFHGSPHGTTFHNIYGKLLLEF